MATPTKVSLHIGINKYNSEYYGANIDLNQCVYDAERLHEFSVEAGFQANLLTNGNATITNFQKFMTTQAKALKKGDFLFISNSSHGTYDDIQVLSIRKRATAICMHDGIFWDFQFREMLNKFKSGVTIVWMCDSCFAESNWRFVPRQTIGILKSKYTPIPSVAKYSIPKPTSGDKRNIRCKMVTYSSSSIFQESYENEDGGVYTTAVISSLKNEPGLSYYQLHRRACEFIAYTYPQSPVLENVRASSIIGNKFLT